MLATAVRPTGAPSSPWCSRTGYQALRPVRGVLRRSTTPTACSWLRSTPPARRRSPGSTAMPWSRACAATATATYACWTAPSSCRSWSRRSPSRATSWCASAPATSPPGPTRCPASCAPSSRRTRRAIWRPISRRARPPAHAGAAGTADLAAGRRPGRAIFQPADLDDLIAFLQAKPRAVPVTPIGVASNILVRDGGLDGVVVKLAGPLAEVEIDGDRLVVGAGVTDRMIAITAQKAGLAGLEFYIGIPGTMGGAVRMNAGAFGGETAAVVERVWPWIRWVRGTSWTQPGFGYRHSALPELDRDRRGAARRGGRRALDPRAHDSDQGRARGEPTDARGDRRQHVQESARAQGMAADRCRRLPRAAPRRRWCRTSTATS